MKRLLALAFPVFAIHAQLQPQSFSTDVTITSSGTGSPNLQVTGNGGVQFSATGVPGKLKWYPTKYAFRAGYAIGTQFDDANVGYHSVAFGGNNLVPGTGGFASGLENTISDLAYWSAAIGSANYIGSASSTLVVGDNNQAVGFCGFVAGNLNTVEQSIAMSLGEGNYSHGWGAMTFGRQLTSNSAGCVVVGMANVAGNAYGDDYYWRGADPVFIIGNGTNGVAAPGESGSVASDALIVYKNGDIRIPKVQGDISMGEFTQ